jgi:hypothetical protein
MLGDRQLICTCTSFQPNPGFEIKVINAPSPPLVAPDNLIELSAVP